jgi:hypothetical protein
VQERTDKFRKGENEMLLRDEKGFCALFVALIFLMSFFCAYEAYGGNAWYKTSWGMSPDEVKKVMANNMEVLSDGTLMLRGYDILGQQYDVAFGFDEKKVLTYVVLNCAGDNSIDVGYGCFLQLIKALTNKYGQPNITKAKQNIKNAEETIYEWFTKDTHISLKYSELPDQNSNQLKFKSFCSAKYESRNVDEKF